MSSSRHRVQSLSAKEATDSQLVDSADASTTAPFPLKYLRHLSHLHQFSPKARNVSRQFCLSNLRIPLSGKSASPAPGNQEIMAQGDQTAIPSNAEDVMGTLLADAAFLSRFCRSQDAAEALSCISASLTEQGFSEKDTELTPTHMNTLFAACLERNALDLCLSIYHQTMSLPPSRSQDDCLVWPGVGFEMMGTLVLALAQRMKVNDALSVMRSVAFNAASADAPEIVFGKVVCSPLTPYPPLTLVQPQEGVKSVACSTSRYMFEVFSGEVTSVRSESVEPLNDVLVTAARFLKLWKKPEIRAIHEMIVTTPSGVRRSFRFGTQFSDVPAAETERVSVVCAPATSSQRNYGLFAPIPPSTQPGEALSLTNHATSVTVPLVRPPEKNTTDSVPSWILPAAVLLAGSDVASSLIDPNLPLIGAASAAALGASLVISNTAVLPRLKQLPENRLGAEPVRQELLARHQELISKIEEMLREATNDVRSLAKLWQLESKMAAVDATGKYDARIQRIDRARQSLEVSPSRHRLFNERDVGYRRVANMIEIEVEMDVDVPAAEIEGIEEQLSKLEEVESLQQEMEFQIEAQDEVERLLRSSDSFS